MKMSIDGAVLPNERKPIIDAKKSLASYANIVEIEAFNLPSPHITPTEMLTLRNLIVTQTQLYKIDGVVITYGTDTYL